jgi:intergrase/recombinase
MIDNRLKRNGFKSRFGDIREYYATFMTRFLNPAEIDFLQGRVSASVFMRNYFNPALITDLKDRIFKALAELEIQ